MAKATAVKKLNREQEWRRFPVPPLPDTPGAGYIYLIKAPSGKFKIGRAKDINNRVATFGVMLPFEIELTHVIPATDYRQAERVLHERFAHRRGRGEWFDLTADDVTAIQLISEM